MTDEIASYIDNLDIGRLRVASQAELPQLRGSGTEGAVVGSNVVSYDNKLPAETRDSVAAWMLLAQIVASQKVPDKSNTEEWMNVYLATLAGSGWVNSAAAETWHNDRVTGATVHEEIIKLLPVLLGPAATALALVTTALTALGNMDQDSPWITLFDRRGKESKAVGFQVVGCTPSKTAAVALDGGDFRIHVSRTMTQVLFFRFESGQASVYRRQVKLELSQHALDTYGPAVRAKVDAWVLSSVAAYELPDPPRVR